MGTLTSESTREYIPIVLSHLGASQVAQWYRLHLPMQETQVQALGQEDPLEEGMATHSSVLA